MDDWSEHDEEREATKEERCAHGRKLLVYEESFDVLFYCLTCHK